MITSLLFWARMLKKKVVKKAAPKKAEPKVTKPVKMVIEFPLVEGGPTSADVHPLEVDNWLKLGWRKA